MTATWSLCNANRAALGGTIHAEARSQQTVADGLPGSTDQEVGVQQRSTATTVLRNAFTRIRRRSAIPKRGQMMLALPLCKQGAYRVPWLTPPNLL